MFAESAPWTFYQNNTVILTYPHNHAPEILLWRCSCHRNEKQTFKSFFNYDANLTSVITMELKFNFFLCNVGFSVWRHQRYKLSWNFEVLLFNSGYWYFLNKGSKFQPNVCNRCPGLLMMSMNFSDIAILNIESSNYCCIFRGISKSEAINLLQNIDLTKISGTL